MKNRINFRMNNLKLQESWVKKKCAPLRFFFFLLAFSLIFSSCKKNSLVKVRRDKIPNEVDYSKVAASAKARFNDGKQSMTLKSSMRMQKDSIFWLSVSVPVLGEAARTIILSDSAKLITKLPKKQYFPYSIAEFSEKYGLNVSPFIIQDLLLGNKIVRNESKVKQKLKKNKDQWILEQKAQKVTVRNFISYENVKIQKVTVESDTSQAMLTVKYADFDEVQGRLIPKNIQIQLLEDKNHPNKTVNLEFSISRIDFEVEEQSYPFKVTSKYKQMH